MKQIRLQKLFIGPVRSLRKTAILQHCPCFQLKINLAAYCRTWTKGARRNLASRQRWSSQHVTICITRRASKLLSVLLPTNNHQPSTATFATLETFSHHTSFLHQPLNQCKAKLTCRKMVNHEKLTHISQPCTGFSRENICQQTSS